MTAASTLATGTVLAMPRRGSLGAVALRCELPIPLSPQDGIAGRLGRLVAAVAGRLDRTGRWDAGRLTYRRTGGGWTLTVVTWDDELDDVHAAMAAAVDRLRADPGMVARAAGDDSPVGRWYAAQLGDPAAALHRAVSGARLAVVRSEPATPPPPDGLPSTGRGGRPEAPPSGRRVVLLPGTDAGAVPGLELLLAVPGGPGPAAELLAAALDQRADPGDPDGDPDPGTAREGAAYRHLVEAVSSAGRPFVRIQLAGTEPAVATSLAALARRLAALAGGSPAGLAGLVRHLVLARLMAYEQPWSLAESYLETTARQPWLDAPGLAHGLSGVTDLGGAAAATRDADLLLIARGIDGPDWHRIAAAAGWPAGVTVETAAWATEAPTRTPAAARGSCTALGRAR